MTSQCAFGKEQERICLVHFARLANTLLNDEESARVNHVLACNFATDLKKITDRLSNKPFLMWLLTGFLIGY